MKKKTAKKAKKVQAKQKNQKKFESKKTSQTSGPKIQTRKFVRIYTSEDCKYCDQAKAFFEKNNVRFEEIKLEDDPSFSEYSEKYGKLGIPVIEIEDRIIVGFNKALLKKILKIRE